MQTNYMDLRNDFSHSYHIVLSRRNWSFVQIRQFSWSPSAVFGTTYSSVCAVNSNHAHEPGLPIGQWSGTSRPRAHDYVRAIEKMSWTRCSWDWGYEARLSCEANDQRCWDFSSVTHEALESVLKPPSIHTPPAGRQNVGNSIVVSECERYQHARTRTNRDTASSMADRWGQKMAPCSSLDCLL